MYIPLLLFIIAIILIAVVLILILRVPKPEETLTFIHIPRNSGSAIMRLNPNWRYEEETSYSYKPPTSEVPSPSFCVVRNPYDRIVSQHAHSGSKKDLNSYIIHKLKKYSSDNYINNCSFVPQYEYAKHATHILHYENLAEEFSSLMKRYNLDYSIDKDKNIRYLEDISKECLDIINEVYEEDFKKLHYTMK